jgi:hypothetical protein
MLVTGGVLHPLFLSTISRRSLVARVDLDQGARPRENQERIGWGAMCHWTKGSGRENQPSTRPGAAMARSRLLWLPLRAWIETSHGQLACQPHGEKQRRTADAKQAQQTPPE